MWSEGQRNERGCLQIPISCPSCCLFEPEACGARRHSRATRCKKKSHGFLLLVSGSHVTTHTHTHSPHFASSTTTLGGLCHLLNASQVWECVCVCDGEGAPSLCAVLAVRATLRCRQPGKSDYSSRYLVSVLNVPKCDGTCSLPTPGRSLITVADRSACRRIREQWREHWGKMVNRCYSDRLVISHSSKA